MLFERLSTLRLAPRVTVRSRWQSQQQSQSQQPHQLSSEIVPTDTGKLVRGPSVKMEEEENLVDRIDTQCPTGTVKLVREH